MPKNPKARPQLDSFPKYAFRGLGLCGVSTYFIQAFINAFLSRNLDQNVPKTTYFLEKSSQVSATSGAPPRTTLASSGWGLHPQTPTMFLQPTDVHFVPCSFLVLTNFAASRKT